MFAQWPSVSYSAIEKVKWRGRGYSHSERRQRARASLPALCALVTLVKLGGRNNKWALILAIFWKLENWRQSQDHALNGFVHKEVKFHPCSSTVALLNDYSIDRDSSVRGSWTKQTNNLTVCLLDNNELLIQWSRGCAAFVLPRPTECFDNHLRHLQILRKTTRTERSRSAATNFLSLADFDSSSNPPSICNSPVKLTSLARVTRMWLFQASSIFFTLVLTC